MNLLPFEALDQVSNPAGVRLGVQEMTRFGMREPEMEVIARLFKKCLIEGKYVGDEVTEFRKNFQKVHFSFDQLKSTEALSLVRELGE
jgi:glycine hydroxymethyltransferase